MSENDMRGVLAPGMRRTYALGGKAKLTILNPATGTRFTYRVTKKGIDDQPSMYFVKVLTGANNETDYQYLGTIFATGFRTTKRSAISPDAPSFRAFEWLSRNWEDARIEVWHEGVCSRCGRTLTVPESIASGIGPTCAGKEAA